MEKNRLEAFSDGVLAIIITIMILELKQPVSDGFEDLLTLWPTLLAYLLSFFFIAIYWVNHHHMFRLAESINLKILWCNIVWLFIMSFIPFTTAWVGSYPTAYAPLSAYFGDMALACVSSHLMIYLIARENGVPFRLGTRSVVSLVVYSAAAFLGGLVPLVSFIAVAAVSLWWIVPEKGAAGTAV